MTLTRRHRAAVARLVPAACLAAALALTGCQAKSTMSKSDEANFKGGPMPPGFLEKNGGGAPPPAAPPAAAPGR